MIRLVELREQLTQPVWHLAPVGVGVEDWHACLGGNRRAQHPGNERIQPVGGSDVGEAPQGVLGGFETLHRISGGTCAAREQRRLEVAEQVALLGVGIDVPEDGLEVAVVGGAERGEFAIEEEMRERALDGITEHHTRNTAGLAHARLDMLPEQMPTHRGVPRQPDVGWYLVLGVDNPISRYRLPEHIVEGAPRRFPDVAEKKALHVD